MRFGTRIEVKKGSDVAIADCRGTALTMGVQGGVGWTIPRLIVPIVNAFLNLVHATPIKDHGGTYSNWKFLFTQQEQTRDAICGGPQS